MSIIAEAFTGKTGKNGSCLFSLCKPTIIRSVSKCAKHEVCQREWCKHECENRNHCNYYQTVLLFTPSFPFCSSKLNQGIRNRTASRYTQKSQELKKYHAPSLQSLPSQQRFSSVLRLQTRPKRNPYPHRSWGIARNHSLSDHSCRSERPDTAGSGPSAFSWRYSHRNHNGRILQKLDKLLLQELMIKPASNDTILTHSEKRLSYILKTNHTRIKPLTK